MSKRTINLSFLQLFLCSIAFAQGTERFYDYKWAECPPKKARFYSYTANTDSGFYRVDYYIREKKIQMTGTYLDSLCRVKNGYFKYYYPNGVLLSAGKIVNNQQEGLWLNYHRNGALSDSIVYRDGRNVGISLGWHPNGFLRDSLNLKEDGSGVFVSWFEDGIPASAGRYTTGFKMHGKWKFYHHNGNVSSVEIYDQSTLVKRTYYDENRQALTDTTSTDRPAEFVGGPPAWEKYIEDELYFPNGYKIINGDTAIVIVTFTVNENGEMEDVFASTPFDPAFDAIAEDIIRESPRWIPALLHNRRVKERFNQLVYFINSRD